MQKETRERIGTVFGLQVYAGVKYGRVQHFAEDYGLNVQIQRINQGKNVMKFFVLSNSDARVAWVLLRSSPSDTDLSSTN